jgi:hypothetical protein
MGATLGVEGYIPTYHFDELVEEVKIKQNDTSVDIVKFVVLCPASKKSKKFIILRPHPEDNSIFSFTDELPQGI